MNTDPDQQEVDTHKAGDDDEQEKDEVATNKAGDDDEEEKDEVVTNKAGDDNEEENIFLTRYRRFFLNGTVDFDTVTYCSRYRQFIFGTVDPFMLIPSILIPLIHVIDTVDFSRNDTADFNTVDFFSIPLFFSLQYRRF